MYLEKQVQFHQYCTSVYHLQLQITVDRGAELDPLVGRIRPAGRVFDTPESEYAGSKTVQN